ncbi:MAG: hypothetical protein GY913_08565 [Proteobacteria bacterium]|nr:hypothetical protein [Pseudomonadota bacterium]MCP4916963.1 hypothetical protein [Pseudomonadota bacterium]
MRVLPSWEGLVTPAPARDDDYDGGMRFEPAHDEDRGVTRPDDELRVWMSKG